MGHVTNDSPAAGSCCNRPDGRTSVGAESGPTSQPFPVQYSTLSAGALQQLILSRYPLGKILYCDYLYRGLNDNYLIKAAAGKFILRVYRHNWRDMRDIESEVELIRYLKANGLSVSYPLEDQEGVTIQQISAPEGLRYAVLFTYARGESPLTELTITQSRRIGGELARMHTLTENRRLKNNRCHLDITALLYESFYAIKPFIEDRQEDMADLEDILGKLKTKFESISLSDLSFGICHGDVYPANCHVSTDDEITLFDFDACCCSWFVMDLAAFCYVAIQYYRNAEDIKQSFIEGYQEVRKLTAAEQELIPYFGAVNHLWVLATQCSNFEVFCHFVRTNIKRNIIGNLKKYVDEHCK
jgi:Ser/Thr protein kinase RdoA (MazF antagonist)